MQRNRDHALERRLNAKFVRRAINADAPLLASALSRYAQAENLTWEQLAQTLDCDVDALNLVAMCRPPRPDRFLEDTRIIAEDAIDVDRLLSLLRRLEVLDAFMAATTASDAPSATLRDEGMLLAARDWEAEEANTTADRKENGEADDA